MSKMLTEILQPLVEMVPEFKDVDRLREWLDDHFPCGSLSSATIVSLAKWMQNTREGCSPSGRPSWVLGAGQGQCALCIEFEWVCHRLICPLAKYDGSCATGENSFYRIATSINGGDKQPLIEALELASVYALVDEFREKCEATIKEASE